MHTLTTNMSNNTICIHIHMWVSGSMCKSIYIYAPCTYLIYQYTRRYSAYTERCVRKLSGLHRSGFLLASLCTTPPQCRKIPSNTTNPASFEADPPRQILKGRHLPKRSPTQKNINKNKLRPPPPPGEKKKEEKKTPSGNLDLGGSPNCNHKKPGGRNPGNACFDRGYGQQSLFNIIDCRNCHAHQNSFPEDPCWPYLLT